METKEYRTVDKTTWGEGPWQHEPDKKQWTDPTTGYPCLIVRGPVGALCGYVGIPMSHPLYGKHYDKTHDHDIHVHGGITFAGGCMKHGGEEAGICHHDPKDGPRWWFGFDCAHAGDQAPKMNEYNKEFERKYPQFKGMREDVYREEWYVKTECEILATHLHVIEQQAGGMRVYWALRNLVLAPYLWVRESRLAQRIGRRIVMYRMKRFLPKLQKMTDDLRKKREASDGNAPTIH